MIVETWPIDYLKPRDQGLPFLAPRSLSGGQTLSGVEQVVSSRSMLWTTTLGNIPLRTPAEILAWRGIAARRRGRVNPILIPFCEGTGRPLPTGYTGPLALIPWSDGSKFSDTSKWFQWAITAKASAAVMGATQIDMTMETGGTLQPGMIFSIGGRLYVIEQIVSIASNVWTLNILPPLREEIPDNSEANFDHPVCRMRLATDNEMNLTREMLKRGVATINLVEDPNIAPIVGSGSDSSFLQLFKPTDLGTKLRAYWDASDYIIDTGVAIWRDRASSIEARQTVAASQPALIAGYVEADGTDDYLTATISGSILPNGALNRGVVALVRQDALAADTTQRRMMSYGSTGTNAAIDVLRGVVGGVNRFQASADPTVDFSGVHIVSQVWRNGQTYRRVDGNQSATGAATLATTLTRYRHFANISAAASNFWQGGKKYEFVVSDPNDLQIWKLEGWIAWQTGLQSILNASHPYKNAPPLA